MMELRHVSAGYGEREVLQDVSLAFPLGKVLALVGPNGCGKSTLIKTALGLQPKRGGEILVDGVDACRLSHRELAQKACYLAQARNIPSITVWRMVLHGRFPYLSYPRRYRPEDYETARRAMERTDTLDLAQRPMQELSGGQRQKVYLAMALAQDTETVFLDEPTTYLDVRHQLEVMTLARQLAEQGKAVVMVLHDLCLAMKGADTLAVLSQGELRRLGTPEEVYVSGEIDRVFGITLKRVETPEGWQYYYA